MDKTKESLDHIIHKKQIKTVFQPIISLTSGFESEVLSFYDQVDLHNGYVTATSRRGVVDNIPLITLTAVFITNESYNYKSTLEISSMLSCLKTNAKHLKAV